MFGTLFGFSGRLTRAGFIESVLSILLIDAAAFLAGKYVEAYGMPWGPAAGSATASMVAQAIPIVFGVLTVWTLLAVLVKRLHDRGKSGWWLILMAIPVLGWLWLLVDLLLPGTSDKNPHGRAPFSKAEPDWTSGLAAPAAAAAAGVAAAPAAKVDGDLDWTGHAGREPSSGVDPADALAAYVPPPSGDAPASADGPLVLDAPTAPSDEPEPEPQPPVAEASSEPEAPTAAAVTPEPGPAEAVAAPVQEPAPTELAAAEPAVTGEAPAPEPVQEAAPPEAPAEEEAAQEATVAAEPPVPPPAVETSVQAAEPVEAPPEAEAPVPEASPAPPSPAPAEPTMLSEAVVRDPEPA